MKSDLIDVACKVVQERDKAIAIVDGTEEEVPDSRTGEVKVREKWFWLPKSQVEINGDGTITLPEWLAMDKGLI